VKVFLEHYKLSNKASTWKVFKTIMSNTNIADLVILSSKFILFTLGTIGLKYFAEGAFVIILSFSFSVLMCFSMIKQYNACRANAFESYSNVFKHELSFFSKNNEYLQFVMFYDSAMKLNIASEKHFERTIKYCNTELDSYSQSTIVASPWFVIFSSFIAASLVVLFWQSNDSLKGIGLFLVIYATLFFIPWVFTNSGKYSALTRLRKFSFWGLNLTEVERQVIEKND